MNRNDWIDLSFGGLAGFLLGVFVMGLLVPPGWPSALVEWAPIAAPAIAILVAAMAIYHAEKTHERRRRDAMHDLLPLIATELAAYAGRASRFVAYLGPGEEVTQARVQRASAIAYSGDTQAFHIFAERLGQFSPDCSQAVLTARELALNVEAMTKSAVAEGIEPKPETIETFHRAAARIVVVSFCGFVALRSEFPHTQIGNGGDIGVAARTVAEVLGTEDASDMASVLSALATHCGEAERFNRSMERFAVVWSDAK